MYETIIVGVDGSPRTPSVIAMAAGLAARLGAQLTLLCAIDPAYDLPEPDGLRPRPADEREYPAAAAEREGVDDLLRGHVEALRAGGLKVDWRVAPGEPAALLLAEAKAASAPLLVLGHRHFGWAQKLLNRSVCEAVLEAASCPVLVLPAAAGAA